MVYIIQGSHGVRGVRGNSMFFTKSQGSQGKQCVFQKKVREVRGNSVFSEIESQGKIFCF